MTFKEYALIKTAADYENNGSTANDILAAALTSGINGVFAGPILLRALGASPATSIPYGLVGGGLMGGAAGAMGGALHHLVREGLFD